MDCRRFSQPKSLRLDGHLARRADRHSHFGRLIGAWLPSEHSASDQRASGGLDRKLLLAGPYFSQAGCGSRSISTEASVGGSVKIVDRKNFPATNIAAAIVPMKPGGLRELHWHPNEDEWQYYVTGTGRMTVFSAGGHARSDSQREGDVLRLELE